MSDELVNEIHGVIGGICNDDSYLRTEETRRKHEDWLYSMAEEIEELLDPGWHGFIAALRRFLTYYPEDIFTGVSGDSGPVFVVALRAALAELDAPTDEDVKP